MVNVRTTHEFDRWLQTLSGTYAHARIVARIQNMRKGNFGDCKPVGEGVSESRIHNGPGYRLYFIKRGRDVVVLLAGGDKSTQRRDVALALRLAADL